MAELTRLEEILMRSIFDCNFSAAYRETLLDRAGDAGCARCKPFYACLKKHMDLGAIITCLPKVEKECKVSQTRIIKTIRLNMQQAGKLLEQDPNILILHLLRDPRAILRSRSVLEEKSSNPSRSIRLLCKDMKQNIIIYESLVDRFKDRMSTLFYEDLAEDSVRISRLVYERLDLKFTNDAKKWVKEVMLGEEVAGYSYTVNRRNAKMSSRKWRIDIAYEFAKEIDEACKYFYQKSGFLPVRNVNMLRKIHFKLRKKSNVKNTIV